VNATELKDHARQRGADLVGIASAERFASLPPESNPLSIAPECRSVIVLARRVLRGSLRGVEEGTNFGSTYGLFGFQWLEDNFLSRTTYELTLFIETHGFEGVPLFGYAPEGMPKGAPVAPDKPAPNVIVDLEFAAQAAGLGCVGLGGFFLTPEYGTRQRMAMVLTDAELEPDAIADRSICGNCMACIDACPLGAMNADEAQLAGVPGYTMAVAAIDWRLCRACPNGAMVGPGRGDRPDRIAAACGRACLDRLERAGKCANRFEKPFRVRTPWAMDGLRRPVPSGGAGNPASAGCAKASEAGKEQ